MAEVGGGTVVDTSGSPPAGSPGADLGTAPKDNGSGLGGPPAGDPPKDTPAPKGDAPKDAPKDTPAAKPAVKTPTIGDAAPGDTKDAKPAVAPADWPEDWRAKAAGDNKKILEKLGRFKSPVEVVNSYLALEGKLSGGEYAKRLPTHFTDAELADYRKANSIPDKAEDYDVNVPGLVWGEADKPMLESWKAFAHANNLPPEIAKMGPAWYAREQENLVARLEQQDMANYQAGTAELQAEWGKEFKGNINAAKNFFEGEGSNLWEKVMGARGDDGRKLGDITEILKFFASKAREANPFAAVLPSGTGANDQAKSAEGRYTELVNMSSDKNGPYWRGSEANNLQAEQRTLIDHLIKAGRMDERGRLKKTA